MAFPERMRSNNTNYSIAVICLSCVVFFTSCVYASKLSPPINIIDHGQSNSSHDLGKLLQTMFTKFQLHKNASMDDKSGKNNTVNLDTLKNLLLATLSKRSNSTDDAAYEPESSSDSSSTLHREARDGGGYGGGGGGGGYGEPIYLQAKKKKDDILPVLLPLLANQQIDDYGSLVRRLGMVAHAVLDKPPKADLKDFLPFLFLLLSMLIARLPSGGGRFG